MVIVFWQRLLYIFYVAVPISFYKVYVSFVFEPVLTVLFTVKVIRGRSEPRLIFVFQSMYGREAGVVKVTSGEVRVSPTTRNGVSSFRTTKCELKSSISDGLWL